MNFACMLCNSAPPRCSPKQVGKGVYEALHCEGSHRYHGCGIVCSTVWVDSRMWKALLPYHTPPGPILAFYIIVGNNTEAWHSQVFAYPLRCLCLCLGRGVIGRILIVDTIAMYPLLASCSPDKTSLSRSLQKC